MFEKLQEVLGIDGESRNKAVLEALGIPSDTYSHKIYQEQLEKQNLEPVSLEKMVNNIADNPFHEKIAKSYKENKIHIFMGENQDPVLELENTLGPADDLNRCVIQKYVQALKFASFQNNNMTYSVDLGMELAAMSAGSGAMLSARPDFKLHLSNNGNKTTLRSFDPFNAFN